MHLQDNCEPRNASEFCVLRVYNFVFRIFSQAVQVEMSESSSCDKNNSFQAVHIFFSNIILVV